MNGEYLEELFLRPQATEVSYSFIEQLVVALVRSKHVAPIEGQDRLSDLLDLFAKMLIRTGQGWIVVKSKHISRAIVLGVLEQISEIDSNVDEILGSLNKLLTTSPVLVKCEKGSILREIVRILKLNPIVSVNMWRVVRSVLTVGYPGPIESQSIVSSALANLAVCRTGYEAAACMDILAILIPTISKNPQMLSTTLGLSRRAASKFNDDFEVLRMMSNLARTSTFDVLTDLIPHPAPEELMVDVVQIEDVQEKEITPNIAVIAEDIVPCDNDSSPKSSCPSLDL